ncbi:MAG: hypothetical protein ACI81P_003044 [Neolewinella sp.]|jgi:hypothetical protein
MRYFLILFLSFSLASLAAQPCHSNVDVTNIKVSYSANNGTSIEGTFVNLSPNVFKAEYKNLTDRGRWKTTTNYTYGIDRRWFIHGL